MLQQMQDMPAGTIGFAVIGKVEDHDAAKSCVSGPAGRGQRTVGLAQ